MTVSKLSNIVGSRGEHLSYLALTSFRDTQKLLFAPVFQGEKFPDADFVVKLLEGTGTFFAQVKSTGKQIGGSSVQARLDAECVSKLLELPGPTYLIAVHEPSGRCFIRSVDRSTRKGISSISTRNELTPENLLLLAGEVRAFWAERSFKPTTSCFS